MDSDRQPVDELLIEAKALFLLDPEGYFAFLARLDAPPNLNQSLRRTMQATASWDK